MKSRSTSTITTRSGFIHLHAVRRLRAMADALERGATLLDVASQYRLPLGALRRVVIPKKSRTRPSKAVPPEVLSQAIDLIRAGHTYAKTAAMLNVNQSALKTVLQKYGYTAKKLRLPSERSENIRLALADYQTGVKVSDICSQRRIAERMFYIYLKKHGIPCRQPHRPARKAPETST